MCRTGTASLKVETFVPAQRLYDYMKTTIFLLIVASASAVAAPNKPRNGAIRYALTLDASAKCQAMSTDTPKKPDTAVCELDGVLNYCWAGKGAGSECVQMPVRK